MKKRLAIITTHPVQYNAPMFALLAKRGNIQVRIFYTWGDAVLKNKFDPGFNKHIEWDIPLLDGYEHVFVKNTANDPGSHHFSGIVNPGLVRDIESWNADAVLVYGWSFKSHLKVLRHFKNRIPVFFRGDSTLLSNNSRLKKWARTLFLRWVYRHVDKALYVGTHNKAYFLKHGLDTSQTVFVPHAVDNERFSANKEIREAEARQWRTEMGIPESGIVFLFAAKLDDNKNAGMLAEAFSLIEKPHIHLVIAGNGELEMKLRSNWKSNPRIHFLPFQNQSRMPVLYRVGDVFVIPSKSETWGLSINEAMSCSRAILASDQCGAAIDLVRDGYNGYIFKSGNSQHLAEQMHKCINDKNALMKMGIASFDLIMEWNYENGCKTIEALLDARDQPAASV